MKQDALALRNCITEGCKGEVRGKAKYCTECSKTREREAKKLANKSYKKRLKELAGEPPPKPKPRQYQDSEDEGVGLDTIRKWRKEDTALLDRREGLNQQLLAQRLLGGAVCNYVGG